MKHKRREETRMTDSYTVCSPDALRTKAKGEIFTLSMCLNKLNNSFMCV